MNRFFIFAMTLSLLLAICGITAAALSKMGSRSDEVRKIQEALKSKGYYTYNTDGIFGTRTKNAVIAFQRDNGLDADGIAGEKTLKALGINESSSGGYSSADFELLARIISAEARGESYLGQVAVGAVILNRIEHPSFPDTLSGVIYQKGAFSCVSNGSINNTPNNQSIRAALDALNGWDPTGGCLYYYNPKLTDDEWIRTRTVQTVIGNHYFAR